MKLEDGFYIYPQNAHKAVYVVKIGKWWHCTTLTSADRSRAVVERSIGNTARKYRTKIQAQKENLK